MKIKYVKLLVTAVLLLTLATSFTGQKVEAASAQSGTIDITSGVLKVRSGASNKYPVIGSLKRSDKVTVYSQTNSGWSEIRYNGKKAYISSDYVRFYKTTSLYSVKTILNKNLAIERSIVTKGLTKAQFYNQLSPIFTKQYLDRYIKSDMMPYSKDKLGNVFYGLTPKDTSECALVKFDWNFDITYEKPTAVFYIKKGVEYLEVSQFFPALDDVPYFAHWQTLYLKKESKSNWKAYDVRYKTYYN